MQAFVPKNRRPKFELHLKIIDLNNVPLVTGTSYVKWHLPTSTSAEHRGHTPKQPIKDHKVLWNYEKRLVVKLTVDRAGLLQTSEIEFEVLQEYAAGARGQRIALGNVKLNLAEYVEGGEGGEEGITRRYLMQESKINSTLKLSVTMKQIEGDTSFVAPPLRTAPVFGGIAGIMSTEPTEPDDLGHLPTIHPSKPRETGEHQDMYRRTLAASWAAHAGELPADECIEDIFAGGTGWRRPSILDDDNHPLSSTSTSAATAPVSPRKKRDVSSTTKDRDREKEKETIESNSDNDTLKPSSSSSSSHHHNHNHNQSNNHRKTRSAIFRLRTSSNPPSSTSTRRPSPTTTTTSSNTLKPPSPAISHAGGQSPTAVSPSSAASSSSSSRPLQTQTQRQRGSSRGEHEGRTASSSVSEQQQTQQQRQQRRRHELDELEVREDLRSWRLPISG